MPVDERVEVLVLVDDCDVVGLDEMVRLSGLTRDAVEELAEAGCLGEAHRQGTDWLFDARSGDLARRARRLRRDFELDDAGAALALALLAHIERLEARLRELECQVLR
jgi:chaperone modulatory protein CbpM